MFLWNGHLLGDMLSQAEMMALLNIMVLERWVGVNGGSRGSKCSSLAGRRTQGREGQDGMALGRNDGNLQGARCRPPLLIARPCTAKDGYQGCQFSNSSPIFTTYQPPSQRHQ